MRLLSTLVSSIAVLVFLASVSAAPVAAQTQKPLPTPTPEPPKSTVKGRVIYDDNGAPVRRSRIALLQLPERGNLMSATDRDGKFEIRDVPAGLYFVMVDSPGVVSPVAFLKITESSGPETLNVKELKEYCTQVAVDGTNNIEVTVRARRGAAISGKVTYSDGSPAVNAQMGVLRRKGNQTTRVLVGFNLGTLASLHTDDRGRYRISGLPPGEYFVSAAETNTAPGPSGRYGGDGFGDFFKNDALTSSYFGNSNRLVDAVALKLELGSEVNNIDIVLADSTPHTISGSVTAKTDGRPLGGATLQIRNKEQDDSFMRGQQQIPVLSDGQWSLPGVPDGTYLISVEPPYEAIEAPTQTKDDGDETRAPTKSRRRVLSKEMEVTVAGTDVSGISIELAEGASVSGTVEVPNASESERAYVMVRYAYEGERADNSYTNSVTAQNGAFTIEPLKTGKIYLSAEANMLGSRPDESAKYYVKSITLNGNDLMQKPLAVEAGQTITNVRIVVSSDVASANVELIDGKGKPVAAKPVVIVSVNPAKWSFANQRTVNVSDANGTVAFSGPPGEYLVIVAGNDDPWPPSSDSIRAVAETATRIQLKAGDNKAITVTVN